MPGDRVLVRRLAFEGKHKIANRWEEYGNVVISQPNTDIPVYVVEGENNRKRRTLHRNHLLPIGSLDKYPEEPPTDAPKPVPRPRRTSVRIPDQTKPATPVTETHDESESDSDSFAVVYYPQDSNGTNPIPAVTPTVEDGEEAVESEQDVDQRNTEEGPHGDDHVVADGNGDGVLPPRDDEVIEPVDVTTDIPPEIEPCTIDTQRQPRRSTRSRKPPDRYTSGQYVMVQQEEPEWLLKAKYIESLAKSKATDKQTLDAIIAIVSGR